MLHDTQVQGFRCERGFFVDFLECLLLSLGKRCRRDQQPERCRLGLRQTGKRGLGIQQRLDRREATPAQLFQDQLTVYDNQFTLLAGVVIDLELEGTGLLGADAATTECRRDGLLFRQYHVGVHRDRSQRITDTVLQGGQHTGKQAVGFRLVLFGGAELADIDQQVCQRNRLDVGSEK